MLLPDKRGCYVVLLIALLVIQGCSKRQALMPEHSSYSLSMLLEELKGISSIESTLEVQYEKGDALMSGDLFIKADEKRMVVRFYYMGFPAGEIIEEEGVVTSKIKIGKARAEMLAEGLKNSIFWWRSNYNETHDTENSYILRGFGREVVIDKKMMLPLTQRVMLANGDSLSIAYSEPLQLDPTGPPQKATDWYQSMMTIEYRDYRVRAKITNLSVFRH